MSETVEVSRRTFMAGAAAAVSASNGHALEQAAATSPEPAGKNTRTKTETSRFDEPGSPSRAAYRVFAEDEYNHYQRMRDPDDLAQQGSPTSPSFQQTKDAVKDLGMDPTGSEPIDSKLESAAQPGVLIVFPPGTYLLNGTADATVDGKFGIAGKGYEQGKPPTPGKNAATLVAAAGAKGQIDFSATTGLLANFQLDMSKSKAGISISAGSDGFCHYRDLVYTGTVDNVFTANDSVLQNNHLVEVNTSKDTAVRITRMVAEYNGLPGSKEKGGVAGVWAGQNHSGTLQIENSIIKGQADNALYTSRTPGDVQVKDGLYANNCVSQHRLSGKGSWSDGATIVVDADNYKGPTPEYAYNELKGVIAFKIERGDNGYAKPGGVEIRNLDMRILSEGSNGVGGAVRIRGSGGAVKMKNSRITNKLGLPSVMAEAPGGGYSGSSAPGPQNIAITASLFLGTNSEKVIQISQREQSVITDTCIKIPSTGPNSISGMTIGKNVSFGKTCKAGGLKAPKKVGSGGELPAVNVSYDSSYTGSAGTGASTNDQARKRQRKGMLTAMATTVVLLLGLMATVAVGAMGAVAKVLSGS